MKKLFMIVMGIAVPIFGFSNENPKDTIAIMDIMSSTYESGQLRMLTDVLRTELFQLEIFDIMERGTVETTMLTLNIEEEDYISDSDLLKIGQSLGVDLLFITTLEAFNETSAINLRIIDVENSLLDYTENIFVTNEDRLFEAIENLVDKIRIQYMIGSEKLSSSLTLEEKWELLGATTVEIEYLVSNQMNPDLYLSLRQYDISFEIEDLISLEQSGWDTEVVEEFLQEGISYNLIETALENGLVDLENYLTYFKPQDLSFDEYLDAYLNNITTPTQYLDFQKGYTQDRFLVGLGGAADSYPLVNANFKFFLLQFGWEHFWTKYQRNNWKFSTEAGIFVMNAFAPTPYFQASGYFGIYPFYFKLGIGGHVEALLGGHAGFFIRPGMEIHENFEFSLIFVVAGTQPKISYTDLETPYESGWDEDGYTGDFVGIRYPYVAATISYKF